MKELQEAMLNSPMNEGRQKLISSCQNDFEN